MLLQRGHLQHHSTLQSLLDGDDINIAIKAEALELPVILASGPKGGSLDPQKAASGEAITAYLRRRALNMGLPPGITHYAWRRTAGTNIARALGPDAARDALGHAPESRTFETSYNEGTVALDLFAVSMGREITAPEDLLEDTSISVNRVKIQSVARRKWIDKFINDDSEYREQYQQVTNLSTIAEAEDATQAQIQAYEDARKIMSSLHRSLMTRAQIALHRIDMENTKKNMTREELEERRKEVRTPGKLQSMLLAAAKEANPDGPVLELELHEETDFADAREVGEAQIGDGDNDQVLEVERQNLNLNVAKDTKLSDSPNEILAASRMLLEVLLSAERPDHELRPCRECQDDVTVVGKQKEKTYLPGKLRQHLATDYHSMKSRWFRKHPGNNIECPYGCGARFSSAKRVLEHALSMKSQSDEHLLAAAKDGLFEPIFEGSKAARSSAMVTRVGYGQISQEIADPTVVSLADMIPPATVQGPRPLIEDAFASLKTPSR